MEGIQVLWSAASRDEEVESDDDDDNPEYTDDDSDEGVALVQPHIAENKKRNPSFFSQKGRRN